MEFPGWMSSTSMSSWMEIPQIETLWMLRFNLYVKSKLNSKIFNLFSMSFFLLFFCSLCVFHWHSSRNTCFPPHANHQVSSNPIDSIFNESIKPVIELTSCTHLMGLFYLYENDDGLFLASDPSNLSWYIPYTSSNQQKKNGLMDHEDFRACLISMGYDLVS